MKNKNVIIGISVVIIVILLGIIIKQNKDIAEIKKSIGIEDVEEKQDNNSKSKVMTKAEFVKYIEKVELTTENWKDYFEITEETEETKNNFGEVTNTLSYIIFKLNNKYYDMGELYNTSLEIEIPKEKAPSIGGEIYNKRIIDFNNKKATLLKIELFGNDKETITLDEIKCIRATGILYYLDNIPKEYWNIADDTIEGSNEYINIDGQSYFKEQLNLKDFVEN